MMALMLRSVIYLLDVCLIAALLRRVVLHLLFERLGRGTPKIASLRRRDTPSGIL